MKSLEEIAVLEERMRADPEARIPQKALAEELTLLVHGKEGLEKAKEATAALFGAKTRGGGMDAETMLRVFANVPSATLARDEVEGKAVFAVAAAAGMFKSNGEARRMAQQGGLSLNDVKIDDKRVFKSDDIVDGRVAVLRSGKKNHFLLKVR